MVILSDSDVKALSLGIAQLIPVFLIALFVIDNSWVLKSVQEIKETTATVIEDAKKSADLQGQKMEGELNEALLEVIDRVEKANVNAEAADDFLSNMRAQVVDFRNNRIARNLEFVERLHRRTAEVIQTMEISAQRRMKLYVNVATGAIIFGILGEIFSLWSAVGLVSNIAVVAFSVSVTVGLSAILSILAINRLTIQEPSARSTSVRVACSAGLCGVTVATFLWILFSVQLKH